MTKSLSNAILAFSLTAAVSWGVAMSPAQSPAPMAPDQQAPALPAKDTEKTTRLTLEVLDDATRKPIYNAHVVVRFEVDRRLRRDKRVSWESKANQRGEVVLNSIPRGTVKIQVIARGYQTYGDQHELNEAEHKLTVAMKTPSGQKSAY